jgi:hypothetical protein
MKLPWSLPADAYDPEPPPILGTWRRVYITTLCWLAFLILLFYVFTRYFA